MGPECIGVSALSELFTAANVAFWVLVVAIAIVAALPFVTGQKKSNSKNSTKLRGNRVSFDGITRLTNTLEKKFAKAGINHILCVDADAYIAGQILARRITNTDQRSGDKFPATCHLVEFDDADPKYGPEYLLHDPKNVLGGAVGKAGPGTFVVLASFDPTSKRVEKTVDWLSVNFPNEYVSRRAYLIFSQDQAKAHSKDKKTRREHREKDTLWASTTKQDDITFVW